MKIVNELIDDVSNGKTDLTQILIKAKVLAHKLKFQELGDWTEHELNGYPDEEKLPDYRIVPCRVLGTVRGYSERQFDVELPMVGITQEMRDVLTTFKVGQSISTMDNEALKGGHGLYMPIPPQAIHMIGKGFVNGAVESAKRVIDGTQLIQLRTAVRTKLLNFLLKLDDSTEGSEDIKPSNQILKEMFANSIFGNNTVIQIGDKNIQNVEIKNIVKGDFEYVRKELKEQGVDDQSILELEEIIAKDNPDEKAKTFGSKVQAWTGKMLGKAMDGSWKIGLGVAGKLLADVIQNYYGWPS
jgi:hypothetical protein